MTLDVRHIRFRVRGRTAAEWIALNEVLLERELGLETDTRKAKFGTGTAAWNDLPYFSAGSGRWYTGTAVPGAGLGEEGDMYLRTGATGTGDVYQRGVSAWALAGNIRGAQGGQGNTGSAGLSAYQVAVANGFAGTQAQWLASLVGAKGDQGDAGPAGLPSVRRVQTIDNTTSGSVSCDWSSYDEIRVTLTADTTFSFSGAIDGQGCVLKLRQDATGNRGITLPVSVRFNAILPSYANTQTPLRADRVGFVYDGQDTAYDLVALVPGI